MLLLLLSIGFIGLFFLLMAVRILFVKGGEFRVTCASQSPWLVKNGEACGYCGKKIEKGQSCAKEQPVP